MNHQVPEPRFKVGDWVQDRHDRGFVGEVIREPTRAGGAYWYDIRTQTGIRNTLQEAALVVFEPRPDPEDLFIGGAFGDQSDLVRLVTFRKLNRPLHDTLYSLGASRTEFHAHQYKPLIKFLDSHRHRLLLADEVGLGKTIEAGLILIEQRARDAVDHVLVVCPASLTVKWKQEMWERFDEEFRILSSAEFKELHNRWLREGPPVEFRGIISLQSLRTKENIELLQDSPLRFDLVVFDEAHHLRNPETLSHRVAAELIPEAHAALLLTATPIHLGNKNLFSLLQLMDPGEFERIDVFEERLRANEPIVEAERLTRAGPRTDVNEIRSCLERSERIQPSYFRAHPVFQRLKSRLQGVESVSAAEAVLLQQELQDVNLLGSQICRSLKRDVFEDAPVRKAKVYPAPLQPAERELYEAVTEFVRSQYSEENNIRYLVAVQAQRQVASCMPAARDRFLARVQIRIDDPEEADVIEDLELEGDTASAASSEEEEVSIPERLLRAARALGSVDSKYDQLGHALRELFDMEPEVKVLLFSYFKDTLRYLSRRLTEDGFVCEVIHGEVPSDARNPERDERRKRMRRFRDPDSGVQILLSSEVGGEGLDFQFCRVLVNYDLPWNPMLVEQRIGRLDRLGQQADRILILNLSLQGTIEDRILRRLHRRIGIFKRSIGDLESIVGEEIGRLSRDLLTQTLSPEEEQRRIDQSALAIENKKRQLEHLEKEAARFMGRDQLFEEKLREARSGGQLLTREDLERFFRHFLEVAHPKSQLRARSEQIYELDPEFDLVHQVRGLPSSPVRDRFYSRLQKPPVRLTFDSDAAFHNDSLEYVGPHHPAIHLAVQYFENHPETLYPAFSFAVDPIPGVCEGVYAFGLFHRVERGRDERHFLEPLILNLETIEPLDTDDSSRMLGTMLRASRTWESPPADPKIARMLMNRIRDAMIQRDAELEQQRRERNEGIIQTQLASLERTHQVRLQQRLERLQTIRQRGRGENVIRLMEAQVENEKARYAHQKRELERGRELTSEHELFACGLVRVGDPLIDGERV